MSAEVPQESKAPPPAPAQLDEVDAFAKMLVEKHAADLLKKNSEIWEPRATWATDLGYDCERRIVYHRVRPRDASAIDATLASIFEEGHLHEKDVRRKLDDMGVEFVEGQRQFFDERLDLSGSIDGKVMIPGAGRKRRVTMEIKSTSGSPPKSAQAWAESESPLMRRYYAQNQIYMVLNGDDVTLALFKSKQTGEWAVLVVRLDYDRAEKLLKRAERVRDSVKLYKIATTDEEREAVLPERLATRAECSSCPWREVCNPAEAPADPALLAVDVELTAQIDRRSELDGPRKEFEKLHEHLKERFKLTAGEKFVVGAKWLVLKKPHGKSHRLEFSKLNEAGSEREADTVSE